VSSEGTGTSGVEPSGSTLNVSLGNESVSPTDLTQNHVQ
jgi:hypothetical protein